MASGIAMIDGAPSSEDRKGEIELNAASNRIVT
jgi:hypothetical protein